MKKFNSTQRFILLFAIAVVLSALSAHAQIVWLAITLGFTIPFVISLFTKGTKKYWFSDTLACLIGSQMGWVALLI